jgi:hypothetical protein
VQWWIEKGEPHPEMFGSFMLAVLTNDLYGAFAKADYENAANMHNWAIFLHTYAPMGCYGSNERLLAWYEARHPDKRRSPPPTARPVDLDCERVVVELPARTVGLLRLLGDPVDVLAELADHAQQGVYRPGSWERPWLMQAFGDDFIAKLEQDPDAPYFQRPKERS